VQQILKVFGIEEGDSFSFVDSATQENTSSLNRDAILVPYLDVLSSFRRSVREYAKDKKQPVDFLKLCDHLRDEIMPELGVRLEDSGDFLYKLVDKEKLLEERALAKKQAREKAIATLKTRIATSQKDLDSWVLKSADPKQKYAAFFKINPETSEFVLDANKKHVWTEEGEQKPKSQKQKIQKEFTAALKNYEAYQQKIAADPNFLNTIKTNLEQAKVDIAELEKQAWNNHFF